MLLTFFFAVPSVQGRGRGPQSNLLSLLLLEVNAQLFGHEKIWKQEQ